jgi:hypothetical protein
MDNNGPHTHRVKKDHVVRKGLQKRLVYHRVSAKLDHKNCALEATHPRQSFRQRRRFDKRFRMGRL